MNIDICMNPGDICMTGGYGIAGLGITKSLQDLGHKVHILPYQEPEANVQINFAFPTVFQDYVDPNKHNIYLFVWESNKLQPGWEEIISSMDEIWTASTWCKKVLEDNGFKVDQVYPHGIDSMWKPQKRSVSKRFKFLFEGDPVARKNGQMAYDAFRAAFGNSRDVELIIKGKSYSSIRNKDRYGSIIPLGDNVRVINETFSDQDQMVALFHQSHCLISPNSGDGFGFPQLQALATGIPVIATSDFLEYKEFVGELSLKSQLIDSPWPGLHPGQVYMPDFDDLVDKYRYVYSQQDTLLDEYYKQSWQIHAKFDWDRLTQKAFEKLVEKFN